jgi:DNA-binding NtrC family response regulator
MAIFKVLIVDDEEAAREGMRKALEREGAYEVYLAESLDSAKQQIERRKRFDVILVDLKLREQDGAEIVRWFKDKSTITIVITAYGSIENCAELMKAGAYDYISKLDSESYHKLLTSIREGLEERARPKPDPNALWVNDNLNVLLEKYPGKYIAILDQEVVAEAPTEKELREELGERFPKQNPMIMSIPAMDERSSLGRYGGPVFHSPSESEAKSNGSNDLS